MTQNDRIAGQATCPDCGAEVRTWRHAYEVHMRLVPVADGLISTRREECRASQMPVVTEESYPAYELREQQKGYGN